MGRAGQRAAYNLSLSSWACAPVSEPRGSCRCLVRNGMVLFPSPSPSDPLRWRGSLQCPKVPCPVCFRAPGLRTSWNKREKGNRLNVTQTVGPQRRVWLSSGNVVPIPVFWQLPAPVNYLVTWLSQGRRLSRSLYEGVTPSRPAPDH